ncbi:MAG: ATP synthase F0 subunit B [Planctomycetes bacterium]|nr:ATP synthase F0 subunit B [Planctomycetota bacterium]
MRFKLKTLLLISTCALMAPALLAAEGHAEGPQSEDGVLTYMGHLMFWEYVTFGLILLILAWKVLPIMLKQLGARQASIRDALDKADKVRAEAEVLLRKHEEMMRDAHADAKKITDDAIAAAREAGARIQAEADAAAKETRERAQKEVEQLTRKAQAELRDAAVELSLLASSRVLQRSLTDDDHRRLAQEAIAASGTMNN